MKKNKPNLVHNEPVSHKIERVNLRDLPPAKTTHSPKFTGRYNRFGFAIFNESGEPVLTGGNSRENVSWYVDPNSELALPTNKIHDRCVNAAHQVAQANNGNVWDIETFDFPYAPGTPVKEATNG